MAHINYYLDICVETFLVNDNAVLLRLHEKYDIWTGPGGHIDPGEDPNEAALREVWEEVGLKAELVGPAGWEKQDTKRNIDLVPPIYLNRHKINDVHDHSGLIFVARTDSRKVNPQTEEVRGVTCVWVTETELDQMFKDDPRLLPETHRYAKTALKLAQN